MAKSAGASVADKPMFIGDKYQPKVTVRVSCGRTRQVAEFAVALPTSGASELAFAETHEKMGDIFRRLGILAPTNRERDNAQGNLQAEEDQEKSA